MRQSISDNLAPLPAMVLSALAFGCGGSTPSSLDRTGEFATYGIARIEGQATTLSGKMLDSVFADVAFPQNRRNDFTTARGFSGPDGRFRLNVFRIQPTANVLDTVTVTFVAAASQTRYRKSDGSFPLDTVQLRLQLVPSSAPLQVVIVNPRLPVP